MKIEQQLIEKGFKEFCDQRMNSNNTYVKSYQLKVRGEEGKILYFINVNLYDFKLLPNHSVLPKNLTQDLQIDSSVQFKSENGEVFNVEYSRKNVDKMVKFYDNLFHTMKCQSYE
tara:strand:+ start:196 stop:540 length:345 start_codon:yes stop_codon:yes gene_type:complete